MSRPATSTTDLRRELAETELPFQAGRYDGRMPAGSVTAHLASRVLVTAPHAVAQQRNGTRKSADIGTGALAVVASRQAGASHLVATGFQHDDGNFSDHGPFKDALRDLLRSHTVVIDVHGMRADHGVDVCLGLGPDRSLARHLEQVASSLFGAAGFSVCSNWPFDAAFAGTVTATAHRHGVAALEIELAPALRDVTSPRAADVCVILSELATLASR